MGWTKRQLIDAAYAKIGLGKSVYDIQAEDYATALLEMDAMVATWEGNNVTIGYPVEFTPSEANLDDETDIPLSANAAIYLSLAVLIAPNIGKTVSPDLKRDAGKAYRSLSNAGAEIPEMQYNPIMPRGAGHSRNCWNRGRTFFGTASNNDTGKDNDNVTDGKEQ